MSLRIIGLDGAEITSGRSGSSRRLDVSARADSRAYYVSRDNGLMFVWTHTYNSDDDDTILLVKNIHADKDLVIAHMEATADKITRFIVHLPTVEITSPTGTTVKGKNLNSARSGDGTKHSTGIGDETTNALGDVIDNALAGINDAKHFEFLDGLRIASQKSIAIDSTIGSTALVTATIIGFFDTALE